MPPPPGRGGPGQEVGVHAVPEELPQRLPGAGTGGRGRGGHGGGSQGCSAWLIPLREIQFNDSQAVYLRN